MFEKLRRSAGIRLVAQGTPALAATAVTAALAPFGSVATAGLAALVGVCALAQTLRRRSAILPAPTSFIGS